MLFARSLGGKERLHRTLQRRLHSFVRIAHSKTDVGARFQMAAVWLPSSITRFGGIRKKSVAARALRCMILNTLQRIRPNREFLGFRDCELPYAGCSDAFFRRALHNRGIATRSKK